MTPVGLDVREYSYGIQEFTVPDAATYTVSTNGVWLVTRITGAVKSTGAGQGIINIDGSTATIEIGGCTELLPGGAWRGPVVLLGQDLYVLIEYWWQGNARATAPVVTIT